MSEPAKRSISYPLMTHGPSPMKILIAEDHAATRKMLEVKLSKWGYEACVAADGNQALGILDKPDPPRIILLDWMMPEIDGLELCEQIRSAKTGVETSYIILLTARTNRQDIITGINAGANDYISKPFHDEELRVRINAGRRIIEMQDELDQRGKIQGVLELAGAVCHEMNQPLQAIMGHTQLLLLEMEDDTPQAEALQRIYKQIERLGSITRKLMHITHYETREYVGGTKIIDLDKATGIQLEPDA